MYIERLKREKQCWISSVTGINKDVLSKFKSGKIDLYPRLFEKLEAYLTNNLQNHIFKFAFQQNIQY